MSEAINDGPVRTATVVHAARRNPAERWRRQYQNSDGSWKQVVGADSKAIHERLCALGSSPHPDEVAEVIGNKSWAHLTCSCCKEYVLKAYHVGDPSWGDTITVCRECLVEAHAVMVKDGG